MSPADETLNAVERSLFQVALEEKMRLQQAAERQFNERLRPIIDAHGLSGKSVEFGDGPDGAIVIKEKV